MECDLQPIWPGKQWLLSPSQEALHTYCEGAQVGNKASCNQHVPSDVVDLVIQVLHGVLPAHLFISQVVYKLWDKLRG